ncbi:MAG: TRAP transporter small permease subunit [Gammaproteobacteria bacterium]
MSTGARPPRHPVVRVISWCELVSEWTGRVVSWLTLLMVLVTFAIVVLRYGFNLGWIGMQESVTYLHAMVFMIGAAYTLKHDGHVRVDIFYRDMSERKRAWVDMLGAIFLLLPVCIFIAWTSWDYVAESWRLRESSPDAGGLPWVYILKTNILIMCALFIVQGIAQALHGLATLAGWHPPPEVDAGLEQEL